MNGTLLNFLNPHESDFDQTLNYQYQVQGGNKVSKSEIQGLNRGTETVQFVECPDIDDESETDEEMDYGFIKEKEQNDIS